MTTYREDVVRVEVRRFRVEAPPRGDFRRRVDYVDISKLWAVVAREYRVAKGLPPGAAIPDEAIWFEPHEEEIVLGFEVSRTEVQS